MDGCHVAYRCFLQQVLRHFLCTDDIKGRVLDSRQVREGIRTIQDGNEFSFHGFESGRGDLARVEVLSRFFEGGAGAFDLGRAEWGEVGFEWWNSRGVWGWGTEVVAEVG